MGGHDHHIRFLLFDVFEDFLSRVADGNMFDIERTTLQVVLTNLIQSLLRHALLPLMDLVNMALIEFPECSHKLSVYGR